MLQQSKLVGKHFDYLFIDHVQNTVLSLPAIQRLGNPL